MLHLLAILHSSLLLGVHHLVGGLHVDVKDALLTCVLLCTQVLDLGRATVNRPVISRHLQMMLLIDAFLALLSSGLLGVARIATIRRTQTNGSESALPVECLLVLVFGWADCAPSYTPFQFLCTLNAIAFIASVLAHGPLEEQHVLAYRHL